MYTLINGSSKNKPSNSLYFLKYISKYLDEYNIYCLKKDNYKDILTNISTSNVIVLAFPLYVDSPNAWTIKFLDYIYDNKIDLNNKKLYVIINCGFKEGEHNITAINIIKSWCKKVNINYYGSILIGAGEVVGDKKYKLICHKTFKSLDKFGKAIKNQEEIPDIITTIGLLNNKQYCKIANIFWTHNARKYKLTKKDIRQL